MSYVIALINKENGVRHYYTEANDSHFTDDIGGANVFKEKEDTSLTVFKLFNLHNTHEVKVAKLNIDFGDPLSSVDFARLLFVLQTHLKWLGKESDDKSKGMKILKELIVKIRKKQGL